MHRFRRATADAPSPSPSGAGSGKVPSGTASSSSSASGSLAELSKGGTTTTQKLSTAVSSSRALLSGSGIRVANNDRTSSSKATSTGRAPYGNIINNSVDARDDSAPLSIGGKRPAAGEPSPSSPGFFDNRRHDTTPFSSPSDKPGPFGSTSNSTADNRSNPRESQTSGPRNLSGIEDAARGGPHGAARAEAPLPPPTPPSRFRLSASSSDHTKNNHGDSRGGLSRSEKATEPAWSADNGAIPLGIVVPATHVEGRGDGQQRAQSDSDRGRTMIRRTSREREGGGRCSDGGGGNGAGHKDVPQHQNEHPPGLASNPEHRALPKVSNARGREKASWSKIPTPCSSQDSAVGAEASTSSPPQLDTIMEDHDPFDDLSAAEKESLAKAAASIQKLNRRQLSIRESFARSHSRLLQGDTGFKIQADAEELLTRTFSLLVEMGLEAEASRDKAPRQQDPDQEKEQGLQSNESDMVTT